MEHQAVATDKPPIHIFLEWKTYASGGRPMRWAAYIIIPSLEDLRTEFMKVCAKASQTFHLTFNPRLVLENAGDVFHQSTQTFITKEDAQKYLKTLKEDQSICFIGDSELLESTLA